MTRRLLPLALCGLSLAAAAQPVGPGGYPLLEPQQEVSVCVRDLYRFLDFEDPGSVEVLDVLDDPTRRPLPRTIAGESVLVRIVPMSIRARARDGKGVETRGYHCLIEARSGRVVGYTTLGDPNAK